VVSWSTSFLPLALGTLASCSTLAPAPLPVARPTLAPGQGASWRDEGPPPPLPRPADNHFFAHIGQGELDADEWEGADNPVNLGFSYDTRGTIAPLHWDFGLHYGDDDGRRDVPGLGSAEVEARIWEMDLGVLAMAAPAQGIVRPYLGTGLAVLYVDGRLAQDGRFESNDDLSFGGYVRGGVAVDVRSGGLVGLDLRYVFGTDVSVGQVDTDVDRLVVAVTFGWAF